MSLLSDRLGQLSNNIFGANVFDVRKSAIELKDSSPTSRLAGDPFKFTNLTYPRDVTQDMANGHYMLFYVNVQNKTKYKYDVQDGTQIGRNVVYNDKVDDEQGFEITRFVTDATDDASYRQGIINRGGKGNVLGSDGVDLRKQRTPRTGLDSVLPRTQRITDSIAIYLPPNVQDSLSAGYSEAATGVAGLAAAGGINFINAMRRNDYAAASQSLVGSAKGMIMEAAKRMGGDLLEGLTGAEGTVGLVNKAFGQATNPYMEVLFEQMGMRSFTYNFTFAPRNADETEDVQRIIKMFRFHMAPELQGANERFLTLPSTFDIHYMYQMSSEIARENSFYHKIATCVLSDCQVDYTPGGVKSFASGAPTQITMSLTFKETEMLTKEMIEEGF